MQHSQTMTSLRMRDDCPRSANFAHMIWYVLCCGALDIDKPYSDQECWFRRCAADPCMLWRCQLANYPSNLASQECMPDYKCSLILIRILESGTARVLLFFAGSSLSKRVNECFFYLHVEYRGRSIKNATRFSENKVTQLHTTLKQRRFNIKSTLKDDCLTLCACRVEFTCM